VFKQSFKKIYTSQPIEKLLLGFLFLLFLTTNSFAGDGDSQSPPPDTTKKGELRYPIENKYNYPFSNSGIVSPLLMPNSKSIEQNVVYDPTTNSYNFNEKIGSLDYHPSTQMSFDQFQKYQTKKLQTDYWQEKSKEASGINSSFLKGLKLGGGGNVDNFFGKEGISITPQGSAELKLGYAINTNENPSVPVRNRRNGSFIFKEKIMMNVTGSIGDKLEVGLNYNTEATFDFENKTKLEYSGKEDEIIKKIEAGDVSFGLPGTLITGSQSLFGIRTDLQFGRLTVSTVLSHQRSESSSINVQGGAQLSEFEVDVDQYDVNRHFFLSQFFRDNYDRWLKNAPYIQSQMRIEEIEVWVTNKQNNQTDARDIVAVMDLGEGYGPNGVPNVQAIDILKSIKENQPADNSLNSLYSELSGNNAVRSIRTADLAFAGISGQYTFKSSSDYATLERARLLSEREYTVNRELGYISLNSPLRNEDVLAVSFTYTYKGKKYYVGELSYKENDQSNKALIVKLLKGPVPSPEYKNWDLMMKNIYSIGAYQVSNEDFVLDVLYRNDKTGVATNYLTEDQANVPDSIYKKTLNTILGLDRLDSRNEPYPDGVFDFIEGTTILSKNGKIIFPEVEPFGSYLENKFTIGDSIQNANYLKTSKKYVFKELYNSTQTSAQQLAEKNKFVIKGHYKGSGGSDIQLNATNIPKGSVKVTAGGRELQENVDYTVDYTMGRVKIINNGIAEAGTPIQVKLENNSSFNLQSKSLIGTHLDYKFSENFNVGGTILRLSERPMTSKVNIGEEPISNTIWGLNTSYRTESQMLTTLIDKLPFLDTKEKSSLAFDAEFAQLIPGQSKMIDKTGQGIAYIDDFEGSQTKTDIKGGSQTWYLSSAPISETAGNSNFYNSSKGGIASGYGRAKLAWYTIDPLFYNSSQYKPDNVDVSGHYVREVKQAELFPEKAQEYDGFDTRLLVLNLNYYPSVRGPYNYNPQAVDNSLPNPQQNWAGIMRGISSSDFETSNIEYIEFWLMDPFVEDTNNSGGKLYFQLGEISEDILRDKYKTFENGFPTDTSDRSSIVRTDWGYAPKGGMLVDGFSGADAERTLQDIGLDGINDEAEKKRFPAFAGLDDPAGDDFKYYLEDTYTNDGKDIRDRYIDYNGMENNSPAATSGLSRSSRSTPDVEEINDDNTQNTSEAYFQYPIDIEPGSLEVGKNFIVDKVTSTVKNSENKTVNWYQFKIPIDQFDVKVNGIEDFKSIRFMRMILGGFEKPVVLRFATLDLVRGEWRRYKQDIYQASPTVSDDFSGTSFEVSSVNIEENGKKQPVNYILPPGIDRATDPNQPTLKQLNEQSIAIKIYELNDNDGRAIYKTTQLDLRQYKNLDMFIHAEALTGMTDELKDNDITAFIRIGSDYQNNYYELEVPLTVTPPGNYADSTKGNEKVWPYANTIKLILDDLVNLKIERNKAIEENPNFVTTQTVYTKQVEKYGDSKGYNIIKIKGNPNLGNIRQIMLGIRNQGDESLTRNDGEPKSAEVWFNELRLTDFNNKGGWAANGQFQAKLADLGIVSVAGAHSTPGFGSIEQTVEQRQKEEINQIDASTNLELGKFFPEKAKVTIPLYVGYSSTIINPEYYPKDPDITLQQALSLAKSKEERDYIKKVSRDVTERKSLNVTNVRWNKQVKKFQLISPSNVSASVIFTETNMRNYSVDYNRQRKYGVTLDYVYNVQPKTIAPFDKWKLVKSPALKIIRDINFNYRPSSFTFNTKLDRNYQTMKLRNVYDNIDMIIDPTTSKGLYWDRNYTLRWDLCRGLKLNYSATNHAIIDEPNGSSDLFESDKRQFWRDSVRTNFLSGGRNLQFNQQYGLDYTVPINKIPLFNWTTLKATYDGTFGWTRGPLLADKTRNIGNDLKNSGSIKLNGTFNMKNLYTKVPYFKKLDAKYSQTQKKKKEDIKYKTVEYSKKTFFKKGNPKAFVHKLGTENVTVKVTDESGQEIKVKSTVDNSNKVTIEVDSNITGALVYIEGKIEKGTNPFVFIGENSVRFLLGVKTINLKYSKTSSTMLPGYLPETSLFGFDLSNYYGAPGYPFVLGMQDQDILYKAHNNGWLTEDEYFSEPTIFAVNETFNYQVTFEPFKGFRIDFTGFRNNTHSTEQDYYPKMNENEKDSIGNRYRGGSFSLSVITLKTAFEKQTSENNWYSASYEKFKENRKIISARLSKQKASNYPKGYYNGVWQNTEQGYSDGYGSTSSEVLMYSFLSAYSGTDPNKASLEMFPKLMMPNWKVAFDGLSNLKFIQKYLKDLTINHSYKSTYTIGSYGTNVDYFPDNGNQSIFFDNNIQGILRDARNNYISLYQANALSLKEEFNPLIGFDMTWNSSLLTKLDFSKSRSMGLSLSNNMLTESRNTDIVIGLGYKFKQVPLKITTAAGTKNIKSDLNVRVDFSIRDNVTVLRPLDENTKTQPSTGAKKYALDFTADYVLSQRLNIQFYFNYDLNNPYVSNQYKNSETEFGFSLKMSL
jgi:cell surface protein SprA